MSATKLTASVDRVELVRPDREEQEDRPVGVAADDVAEHSQRVVVRPLDVVDEQGERADVGDGADGHAREVEGAQELGVRREALEAGLVATGHRVDDAAYGGLSRRPGRRVPDRGRREEAARDEERAADLLVGRDGDHA